MKKVLIIVPLFPLGQLEKEDYFKLPANIAKEKGYEVEFLTTQKGKKEEIVEGYKVKRFSNGVALLLYALKERPVIMHTFLRPYPVSLFAGLLPFKKLHTAITYIVGSNKLVKMLSVFLLKRFDKLLALTPYEIDAYTKAGVPKNKIVRLPLSVDYELFNKPRKTSEGMKILKVKGKKPFIITNTANYRYVKRIDVLMKAFSIIKKQVKNAKLVFVGKDYLKEENKPSITEMAEELGIEKDVIQTGFLDGKKVKRILDATDVFVMSSSQEAQCLAVYEAAIVKVPLCLTRVGSFTSVFKDYALYHEVEDAEQLAANILQYHKDKKTVKRNAEAAKKIAKIAAYEKVKKEMKNLYEETIRGKGT